MLQFKIAKLILNGFSKHYRLFQDITSRVPEAFAKQNWGEIQGISKARISHYDHRVDDTILQLKLKLKSTALNEPLWHHVKIEYLNLLSFHPQAELAESYYNSVFCRLFHRKYFNNDFIFVQSTLNDSACIPVEAEYRSYFPVIEGLKSTIQKIVEHFNFKIHFENLDKDIKTLLKAFIHQAPNTKHKQYLMRFDILHAPFYRNKAAYIVGRVVTKTGVQPFIIAVLHSPQGGLCIDTLITDPSQMRVIFGFARTYFLVETHAPSALIRFLHELMPSKTPAELYNSIGFHKQGKTEFYRAFLAHLEQTKEQFAIAPGTPGLVMMVFTLPSFPYVFKVIKDTFSPSKPFGRDTVLKRYQLVKNHDRVGRMADTIEYSDVVIPKSRIKPQLYEQLLLTIKDSLIIEDSYIVIKHLYIERRMIPLNLFIKDADEEQIKYVIKDYGLAIKEMLQANIFPGDMLLKNFGVSNHSRIIFYDYDEVQYLTDMNFRAKPETSLEDLYSGNDDYSAAPQDVFVHQLCTFVLTNSKIKEIFKETHSDLLSEKYWQHAQKDIKNKVIKHIYPYPQSQRFINLKNNNKKVNREY